VGREMTLGVRSPDPPFERTRSFVAPKSSPSPFVHAVRGWLFNLPFDVAHGPEFVEGQFAVQGSINPIGKKTNQTLSLLRTSRMVHHVDARYDDRVDGVFWGHEREDRVCLSA